MTRHAWGSVSNGSVRLLRQPFYSGTGWQRRPPPSEPSVQRKRSCHLAHPALLFLTENAAGHDRTFFALCRSGMRELASRRTGSRIKLPAQASERERAERQAEVTERNVVVVVQ